MDRNVEAVKSTATYINTRIDAAGLGGSAFAVNSAVDISNLKQVETAVKESVQNFEGKSRLHGGVNCAGITVDKFLLKTEEEDWDRVLNINLKGTFFFNKAIGREIIDKQGKESYGSIVNISSIIGKVGNIGQANYSASKGGVIAFSKTAAKEFARNRIRVNALLPGFINTPMAAAVPDKVKDKMIPQIPLGAFGEADDIADMCVFLISDRSKYVTGAVIEVSGGLYM